PTEAFTEDGVDEAKIEIIREKYFTSPRIPEIYTPPLILLKENIGEKKIPIYFSSRYITYKDKIVGIKAPKKDVDILTNLYDYLQKRNDLFRLYIAATSNQLFINKNTAILKQDLMAIPYPENISDLKLSFAEKIIKDDVLKYGFEYLRRNENKITGEEANKDVLVQFAEVFCKALNSVYGDSDNKSFKLNRIIESNSWVACDFTFTGKEVKSKYLNSAKAEDDLMHLIENGLKKNLRINRIVRYYTKNNIILIKPKQLRYWLKSTALRDADDSLQDLIKAGY
ncbi:MAG: SAM-dependent methyltransferase, partial [Bacteroidota bacterium]|nr:SAM-dependent methyltransferase [Bacteroidota bacterium]